MTKHEFISELKQNLRSVPAEVREEILSDIAEHFSEGAANGISEEEICRNLGQTGSISAQVLEDYSDWAGRGGDRDNSAHTKNIDAAFTGVHSVDADFTDADILFVPSPADTFRVVITGQSKHNVTAENNDGVLVVKSEKRSFADKFFAFFSFGNLKATIYVPSPFVGEIKARTASGNIFAEKICGVLNFSSASGNVTVTEHRGNKISLRTASGNAKAQLLDEIVESVTISTASGNAKLQANETGALKMSSASGNVKARLKKIGGDTKLSTASGNVKLTAEEVAGNIDISTASGDAKVFLPKDANCRINVKKPAMGSLRNELAGNEQSPFILKVSTAVGSIRLNAL